MLKHDIHQINTRKTIEKENNIDEDPVIAIQNIDEGSPNIHIIKTEIDDDMVN